MRITYAGLVFLPLMVAGPAPISTTLLIFIGSGCIRFWNFFEFSSEPRFRGELAMSNILITKLFDGLDDTISSRLDDFAYGVLLVHLTKRWVPPSRLLQWTLVFSISLGSTVLSFSRLSASYFLVGETLASFFYQVAAGAVILLVKDQGVGSLLCLSQVGKARYWIYLLHIIWGNWLLHPVLNNIKKAGLPLVDGLIIAAVFILAFGSLVLTASALHVFF